MSNLAHQVCARLDDLHVPLTIQEYIPCFVTRMFSGELLIVRDDSIVKDTLLVGFKNDFRVIIPKNKGD